MPVKQFTIPGNPIGKPRMTRRDKWAKRPCVVRYRDWCDLARLCAGKVPDARSVTDLQLTAVFEMPQSWSEKQKSLMDGRRHRKKPDADNIAKCVDGLWTEDSGLADVTIRKRWGRQGGLHVRIEYDDRATAA